MSETEIDVDATEVYHVEDAIAGEDQKLSPEDVPVMEVLGVMKMPATEGKTMLAFGDDRDCAVGVRLEDDDLEDLARNLEAFR